MTVRMVVRVTGRVQGVGFRDYARRLATGMGLTGFVRNEPDGSVHAEIEGERETVEAFVTAMREQPPRFARIDDTELQVTAPAGESGFRITG